MKKQSRSSKCPHSRMTTWCECRKISTELLHRIEQLGTRCDHSETKEPGVPQGLQPWTKWCSQCATGHFQQANHKRCSLADENGWQIYFSHCSPRSGRELMLAAVQVRRKYYDDVRLLACLWFYRYSLTYVWHLSSCHVPRDWPCRPLTIPFFSFLC